MKADDRHSILKFPHARWDMAQAILHDVGFLLNPLNLEPWAVVSVMEGFRELIRLRNEFIARDGDSPEMTIAKATNELEIYIDVAKNSATVFVSKICFDLILLYSPYKGCYFLEHDVLSRVLVTFIFGRKDNQQCYQESWLRLKRSEPKT